MADTRDGINTAVEQKNLTCTRSNRCRRRHGCRVKELRLDQLLQAAEHIEYGDTSIQRIEHQQRTLALYQGQVGRVAEEMTERKAIQFAKHRVEAQDLTVVGIGDIDRAVAACIEATPSSRQEATPMSALT